jgi:hypothetical protein
VILRAVAEATADAVSFALLFFGFSDLGIVEFGCCRQSAGGWPAGGGSGRARRIFAEYAFASASPSRRPWPLGPDLKALFGQEVRSILSRRALFVACLLEKFLKEERKNSSQKFFRFADAANWRSMEVRFVLSVRVPPLF